MSKNKQSKEFKLVMFTCNECDTPCMLAHYITVGSDPDFPGRCPIYKDEDVEADWSME